MSIASLGVGDDFAALAHAAAEAMEEEAFRCSTVAELLRALQTTPDLTVILGEGLPSADLLETVETVVKLAPHAAIAVVTPDPWSSRAEALLAAGAHEVVTDDLFAAGAVQQVIRRARIRNEYLRKLREASLTDPLTGLLNRRGYLQWTEQALRLADRMRLGCLIMLLDMNDLKRINDRAGHHAGDQALCALAQAIKQALRASDAAGRIGGDEFAVTALGAGAEDAEKMVERIRAHLQSRSAVALPRSIGDDLQLDFAAGWVAYVASSGIELEALLDAADVHLYAEKTARAMKA
jgi:diguanylate cyclase (GGDEF)-like protein